MTLRLVCRSVLLLAVVLALVPGCESGGPQLMTVAGTVTCGGKPAEKLVVNFWPESGRPSHGLTDAEGHYALDFDGKRAGAVPGKHKVWVQIKPTSPKEEADLANGLFTRHPRINAIIEKYGNQSSSPLWAEVKENNQIIDLALD